MTFYTSAPNHRTQGQRYIVKNNLGQRCPMRTPTISAAFVYVVTCGLKALATATEITR